MDKRMRTPPRIDSCGSRFGLPSRLISLLLSFAMLFTVLPTAAFAVQSDDETSIGYNADGSVTINANNFPDPKFRGYISASDTNKNGRLDSSEILYLKDITLTNYGLTSLKGIEYLYWLRLLNVGGNELTSLDVSQNARLTTLLCDNNPITSLVLNSGLESLSCISTNLYTLNVNMCSSLKTLYCSYSGLISLSVSGCTKLKTLDCSDNSLSTLELSNCKALTRLNCDNNNLTALHLNPCANLLVLSCKNNQINSLWINRCAKLDTVNCNYNELDSLDVSGCTNLASLYCFNNQLNSLDVSNNTNLTTLYCGSNRITSLDVSQNSKLKSLNCSSNQLTSIDVSKNTYLKEFNAIQNKYTITSRVIDLSDLPGNFDVNKTFDWDGGSVEDGILIVNANTDTVTYEYECGHNNESVHFTLNYTHVHDYTKTNYNESTHWRECPDDGEKDEITVKEHIRGTASATTPPSEIADGVITIKCADCDYSWIEPAHNYSTSWFSNKNSHWHACTNDGTIKDMAAHTSNDGVVTTEPTTETEGTKTYSCTECGYVIKTETIDKLTPEHTHTESSKWTSDKTGHWKVCTEDGEKISSTFAEHTSDEGVVTTPPTTEATGVKTYSCTECDYTIKTETIDKLPTPEADTYAITVYGGKAYSDAGYTKEITSAKDGDTVWIKADNRAFEGWVSEGDTHVTFDKSDATDTWFHMPAGNVVIRAAGDAAPAPSGGGSGGGAGILILAAGAVAIVGGAIAVVMMMPVTISGHVVHADNKAVIPNATIQLKQNGSVVATTAAAADGSFSLSAKGGEYDVVVTWTDENGQPQTGTTQISISAFGSGDINIEV